MCATFPPHRKAPAELVDRFRAAQDGCEARAGSAQSQVAGGANAGTGLVGGSSGSAPAQGLVEAGAAVAAVQELAQKRKRARMGPSVCQEQ